jgi:hypothetical protein
MLDLYTWTTPNGRKMISIALEELGLCTRRDWPGRRPAVTGRD